MVEFQIIPFDGGTWLTPVDEAQSKKKDPATFIAGSVKRDD
jgi:hypothetical protein